VSAFVDTSAFLAVLSADDPNHEKAAEVWRRLLADDTVLLTTSYVLVETFAVAQRRLGMEAVRTFHEDVVPVLSVVWVDEAMHSAGARALLAAGKAKLSLVDCVSFHVMRAQALKKAFAFDRDFEDQGFDCNP